MTIYLTASLALLLLAQLALDLTVLLRLVLKKPAHRTSEEVEKAILDLGIPTDGAVRVRAIREDPKVFEKVKAAARLRVAVEETGGIDNFLILAGLSCEAQRQHAGILAAALLANGTVIGGALALYFGFGTLGGSVTGSEPWGLRCSAIFAAHSGTSRKNHPAYDRALSSALCAADYRRHRWRV